MADESLQAAVDAGWVLISTMLVFLMQAGFTMLEIGAVREKHAQYILLKKLLDAAISTLVWCFFGYSLAYGQAPPFGEQSDSFDWTKFVFNWAFCATSVTIISGCVAERTELKAYLLVAVGISSFVYPAVVRSVWADDAWLSKPSWATWLAFHDFAGSSVVHLVGGLSGLIFSWRVGPRIGRFANKDKLTYSMGPHNVFLVGSGTLLLWFGWYGFNAGSTLQLSQDAHVTAARIVANISVSPAAAAVAVAISKQVQSRGQQLVSPVCLCNALLAGLVSITAPCAVVDVWAALPIGCIGGLLMQATESLLVRFKIDDPVGAFPVHGACGVWGTLSVGMFGAGWSDHKASWQQFASQIVGLTMISAWTSICTLLLLTVYMLFWPIRISPEQELGGFDHLLGDQAHANEKVTAAPDGRIAIVITDVQGSTALWAADPAVMGAATALHDHIMRLEIAAHDGYEITTEGDAFFIAFPTTTAALKWCIATQRALMSAPWSSALLAQNDAGIVKTGNGGLLNRGLRVRMGIDVGWCKRKVHSTTKTFRYTGRAVSVAKEIVDVMPSGGIVCVSHRVQPEIAPKILQFTDAPLVTHDFGIHLLSHKSHQKAGIFTMMPQELAPRVIRMPPLETAMKLTLGYFDSPGAPTLLEAQRTQFKVYDSEDHAAQGKPPARNRRWLWNNVLTAVETNGPSPEVSKSAQLDNVVVTFASLRCQKIFKDRDSDSPRGKKLSSFFRSDPGQLPNCIGDSASDDPHSPCTTCAPYQSEGSLTEGDQKRRPSTASTGKCPSDLIQKRRTSNCSIDSAADTGALGQVRKGLNRLVTNRESELEQNETLMKSACQLIRGTLLRFEGYECQEEKGIFMLAFASPAAALLWASSTGELLQLRFKGKICLAAGSHYDAPTELRPHNTTGRADYFGPLVNSAARVHSKAVAAGAPSCVYATGYLLETAMKQLQHTNSGIESSIVCTSAGMHNLKGFKDKVELWQFSYRLDVSGLGPGLSQTSSRTTSSHDEFSSNDSDDPPVAHSLRKERRGDRTATYMTLELPQMLGDVARQLNKELP